MSTVLLSKDQFPKSLGGGLESDLTLDDPFLGSDRKWSAAIANTSRLKKAESEAFRLKLEELTGLSWEHDSVSKFVFHYIPNSKEKIMTKDLIQVTKEPHVLPCKLNEANRAEAADKLATALQRVDSLKLEKKAKMAEFKGMVDHQEERIHKLTVEVKDGVAQRPVECELKLNYSKLSATLVRLDTEDIVEERTMSEDEKQMKFEFEKSKKPKKSMKAKVEAEE